MRASGFPRTSRRAPFLCLLTLLIVLAHGRVAWADPEYVPGEVIIVYEDDVVPAEVPAQDLGVVVGDELLPESAESQMAVAEVPQDMSVEQAVDELEALPGVALVQPNYILSAVESTDTVRATDTQIDDAYYKRELLTNLGLADVLHAWDLSKVNGSVTVAVVDSGCRLTHEDLVENLDTAHAWDYLSGGAGGTQLVTSDGDCGDDNGHGTAVCGVVGARANNGLGVAGASYDARILPLRVLDSAGSGSTASLVVALYRVLDLNRNGGANIRVVNLSMGAEGISAVLDKAIKDLFDENVLCVCARGNTNISATFIPADCEESLAVMALDSSGRHTSYTNYKVGADINTAKTVSAMGGASYGEKDYVWSTGVSSDGSYVSSIGTSLAAPLVSGVAALMWAVNPELTVAEVRQILVSTTDPVDSSAAGCAHKDAASAGSVNAYKAVAEARRTAILPVPVPSAVEGLTYTGVEQTGVPTSAAYVLEGHTATTPGEYTATATLQTGFKWEDGTTAPKQIPWSMGKATLTATYAGETILKDATPAAQVEVTGFVNGETPQTASGYVAPAISLEGVELAVGTSVSLTPAGGQADNYDFEYVAGTLSVIEAYVAEVPSALSLRYTGRQQTGVPSGAHYTILGNTGTQAGDYVATASLEANSKWADDSVGDKQIPWSIDKARLSLAYKGGSMLVSDDADEIPRDIEVTGFVEGESLEGLMALGGDDAFAFPKLVEVTVAGGAGAVPADATRVNGAFAGQDALGTRDVDASLATTVGSKVLIPDAGHKDGATISGNPTANYCFHAASAGTLRVYDRVVPPVAGSFTYDGTSHLGIAGGAHYAAQGTTTAKDAGSYDVTVTPDPFYVWPDMELEDEGASAPRAYTWRVEPADIGAAKVDGVTNRVSDGSPQTQAPVITMGNVRLREGVDYTVSYEDNVEPGTATLVIAGKGNYGGTKRASFSILHAFPDVAAGSWYEGVVSRAAGLGLVMGYRNGSFGPSEVISRAQVVTILWRMAGCREATETTPRFGDATNQTAYCYPALCWASSTGVVSGYSNGLFGPHDHVTREQLATMLANYASRVGGLEVSGSPDDYANMRDATAVSPYARRSLGWCF